MVTKIPQFRVRTLLLLTAIMGVLFVACAKCPVTEMSGPPVPLPTTATFGWKEYKFERPPTVAEWAVRAGVSSSVVLAAFVLIGAWHARKVLATESPRDSLT